MRSLKLAGGDIVLDGSGRAVEIVGREKLIQDLRLWLMEPLGVGFLTPNFGSILHDFIGGMLRDEQVSEIEDEIRRVIDLFQATQIERMKAARQNGGGNPFTAGELLDSIEKIESETLTDAVVVTVTLRTLSDENIDLAIAITDEGVVV